MLRGRPGRDAAKVAQHFSAGLSLVFLPSLPGLTFTYRWYPALKCWAIIVSSLPGRVSSYNLFSFVSLDLREEFLCVILIYASCRWTR